VSLVERGIVINKSLFPAFRDTLVAGGYNLLLGAGASLDSTDVSGNLLPSGDAMRRRLCTLTGAPETTSLTRVYNLLTSAQIKTHLVEPLSPCSPGPTVSRISHFLWRRLFTLNIDDVVERHYESLGGGSKQELRPLNYDAPFEPTPERYVLQAIHLHGWAREPDSGFVFSTREYARTMKDHNPWMRMLAEILATEPFIIAGTGLNEADLEYYLSFRTASTPRRGIGPSFLVEPSPDVVARNDCERHGLELVEAPLGEFLEWLAREIPTPPSVTDLLVPDRADLFDQSVDKKEQLRFFYDFEVVEASDEPLPEVPSPFLYGREPGWRDLDQHCDIVRLDYDRLPRLLDTAQGPSRVVVLDEPGAGKTTLIKRAAHMRVRAGRPVLHLRTFFGIDVRAAASCLARAKQPVLLLVDNVADHASQLHDLFASPGVADNVMLLGAERFYRRQHIEMLLGGEGAQFINLTPLAESEALQLIERFRGYGLLGTDAAIKRPEQLAGALRAQPLTLAVCRILNDFRPLDIMAKSLWDDTEPGLRRVFLCVALAQRCHWTGLRYSIAQTLVGPTDSVSRLLGEDAPLRLTEVGHEDTFLLALNWATAERVLERVAKEQPEELFGAFLALTDAIAPYVNRRAIIRRSPEARLAGRLFDVDSIVKPLVQGRAPELFRRAQTSWEWNSRYWEQRALLHAGFDLEEGVRYARHALSVERHPFGLTTLGKILIQAMEADDVARNKHFAEALTLLSEAIEREAERSRVTAHPFMSLLNGVSRYLEMDGRLDETQWQLVVRYANEAEQRFHSDPQIQLQVRRLDEVLDRDSA